MNTENLEDKLTLQEKNIQIVTEFLKACEDFDFDKAWGYVTDDFYYRNNPFPATKTKESSKKQLKLLVGSLKEFKVEIHQIAANGNVVLNERSDIFIGSFFYISLPVNGIFKIRDGKICQWDDHFDFLTLMIASLKSPFIVIGKLLN
jgi:limonene-1,2-epoxide hydrolase